MSTSKKIVNSKLYTKIKTEAKEDRKLLSFERLDRDSPDLWPEQSIDEFIAMSDTPIHASTSEWSQDLTEEDRNAISHLSAKAPHAIIMEIKKIHDEAYQLGVREAKEMTRGKYLGIFSNFKKKS